MNVHIALRVALAGRKVKVAGDLVDLDEAVRVTAFAAVNNGLFVDAFVDTLLD